MTRVQEFLRAGGTLADLAATYAIKARRHGEFPNLVSLKYSQVDSPMGEPLVQECRGLILDEADDWAVVCRTFDKFFNHGEGHAAPIDWSTAVVQEKLDGSLMQLYFYRGEWRVASSGLPDASGKVVCVQQDGDETFAGLFWRTWKAQGLHLPPDCYARHVSFAWELTTPFNRVVVPQSESRLTLIGIRDHMTGQEFPVATFADRWPVVREFPLDSFDACLSTFQTMSPLAQEGYVIVDGDFRRVKVKHPGYVAISHMAGKGCGPRRVLEIVRSGESAEVLAHFPEWRSTFDDLAGRYESLVAELESAYRAIAHIPAGKDGQKAFALEANRTRYPSALFLVRAGKAASIRAHLATVQIDHLLRALDVRDEPEIAEAA